MLIIAIVMFISIIFMTLVHELAHMLTAKIFKIPVVEFAIGFGPKIFSKKFGETLYSLRLLPFGGYCSFTDADDAEGKLDKAVSDKNLYLSPSWQRAMVLAAGPTSNLVLAIICLLIGGLPLFEGMKLCYEITFSFFQNVWQIFNPMTATSGGMMVASVQMANMVMDSNNIFRGFWIISGSINFLLGLTNLLPIPALDGFSIYWALGESISKRKFSIKLEGKLKMLGMLGIYLLMFLCCVGDIIHFDEYIDLLKL